MPRHWIRDDEAFSCSSRDAGVGSGTVSRERAADGEILSGINRRNRDLYRAPPLPTREPSKDGRSAGGIVTRPTKDGGG